MNAPPDARLEALEHWTRQQLDQPDATLHPASGDASFRRYFRVINSDPTLIAVDAPPTHEDSQPFIDITDRLSAVGLNTPRILHHHLDQGFLLISDLGQRLYLPELNQGSVERLYGDALGALSVMQACAETAGLPLYDEALLMREMMLFRDWLVDRHLGILLTTEVQELLDSSFHWLCDEALAQPRVFVHRDYHSRNLMCHPVHNPGILDFQDAVLGPVTYDLVSLLKDCYIAWPRDQVLAWVRGYFDLAVQMGILAAEHESSFVTWFDLMGVQRQLKASGIFARLYHRDGKNGYLKDIPRTLGYIAELEFVYPRLQPLARWIATTVLPRL